MSCDMSSHPHLPCSLVSLDFFVLTAHQHWRFCNFTLTLSYYMSKHTYLFNNVWRLFANLYGKVSCFEWVVICQVIHTYHAHSWALNFFVPTAYQHWHFGNFTLHQSTHTFSTMFDACLPSFLEKYVVWNELWYVKSSTLTMHTREPWIFLCGKHADTDAFKTSQWCCFIEKPRHIHLCNIVGCLVTKF